MIDGFPGGVGDPFGDDRPRPLGYQARARAGNRRAASDGYMAGYADAVDDVAVIVARAWAGDEPDPRDVPLRLNPLVRLVREARRRFPDGG